MLLIVCRHDNFVRIFQWILSFRINIKVFLQIYKCVWFLNVLLLIDHAFLVKRQVSIDSNSKLITFSWKIRYSFCLRSLLVAFHFSSSRFVLMLFWLRYISRLSDWQFSFYQTISTLLFWYHWFSEEFAISTFSRVILFDACVFFCHLTRRVINHQNVW
jgi:predicted membrane protein